RWPELPDVPTLGEAGFPEAIAEAWQGFLAPSGTPEAVIGRIAAEVIAILQRSDIREKFHAAGFAVGGEGGQALRALITSEVVKWRDVITRAGIKGEGGLEPPSPPPHRATGEYRCRTHAPLPSRAREVEA